MKASIEYLHHLVERLAAATAANTRTRGRRGSVVQLGPEDADLVLVTGDLHGNRPNFNRIVAAANLEAQPRRHLVLQEVVHGGPTYPNGACMSHMLLEDVAALKVKYPDRVHFLLCNHELAEVLGTPLLKAGHSQNQLFNAGLEYAYGPAAGRITEGLHGFIRSCPLAIRLKNGVFISHSLPDAKALAGFDPRVYARELLPSDLQPGGPAYQHVWGRDYQAAHAAKFADIVRSTVLLHGHEPTLAGYQIPNPHQILFDASGPRCFVLPVPTTGKLAVDSLSRSLLQLN